MKKTVINLIALGTASFGFAQNSYSDFDLSRFRELGISGSNHEYLRKVQNGLTPGQVKYVEKVASNWDVPTSKKFDGRKGRTFKVTFKLKDGKIDAFYDSEGKVFSTVERFSNFAMPKSVGKEILRQYPNWEIVKNRYSVWYGRRDPTKKSFKVLVRKGNRKKWLRIDPSGNIS